MTWITIAVIILSQVDGGETVAAWLVTTSGIVSLLMVIPMFVSSLYRHRQKSKWRKEQQQATAAPVSSPAAVVGGDSKKGILVPPTAGGQRDRSEAGLSASLLSPGTSRTTANDGGRQKKQSSRNRGDDFDVTAVELAPVSNPLLRGKSREVA